MDGVGSITRRRPYNSRRALVSETCDQAGPSTPSRDVRRTRRRASRREAVPLACSPGAVPTVAMRLEASTYCDYCRAKKFQFETPAFCCSNGEVSIKIHELPRDLANLYRGRDCDSQNFRTYSRLFNNLFAFSSIGGRIQCETYRGIYVFKLHGQIYHNLPSLLPEDGNPKYLQLYFYDGECEYDARSRLFKELRPSVIERLMRIMEFNPYAQFFQSLRGKRIDENTTIQISKNPALNQHVYNSPTSSDVAAILLDSTTSSEFAGPYIIVTGKDDRSRRVMHYYGCYDPLQYPLLFPYGQSGWRPGLVRHNRNFGPSVGSGPDPVMTAQTADEILHDEDLLAAGGRARKSKQISCREYYAFMLQIHVGNYILDAERLLQQFCVDMYVKLENTRLDFFRHNQDAIRADLYQGIIDTAETGEENAANAGHKVILPPSFIGGPRDMQRRYLNAMALVQRFGKPDLFVTMTCNPNWAEIKAELKPGQQSQSRPDLLARIFHAKLLHLKKLLAEKHVFGEVAAYIYVVEFQKRGLPHAHFLIILKTDYKIRAPEDFDKYVCAEIPPTSQPHLRNLVINHMMHGPCGVLNPKCGCMREENGRRRCRFNYPKEYTPFTTTNTDGFPTYKRTNTGEAIRIRGVDLDNRWVIPYNPYLIALFDCHINVEVCATVEAVKYLYKYVYKGHDRVAFNVVGAEDSRSCDEIDRFQSGRWISPPEAVWRVFSFALFEMSPPVFPLQVHLPNMQNITFSPVESISSIVSDELRSKSLLTEYFATNRANPDGPKYLYSEFPEYYTWESKGKKWKERQRGMAVGRLTFVNPSETQRFHLRLLLTKVRGAMSFCDLLTVDGHAYASFYEAAVARGLVESDDIAERCLDEAVVLQMPHALRRLFVTLLVFCSPPNPKALWDKYYIFLSADVRHQNPGCEQAILTVIVEKIRHILDGVGKRLEDFGLEFLVQDEMEGDRVIRDIQDVLSAPIPEEYMAARKQLNEAQKRAYKCIVQHVKSDSPGCFFVDGPGGTGKTFLYNALYAKVRSLDKIVLPTASSGIAAANLPCGRTAHSRFKLPIDHEAHLTCNVPKQGALASLLKRTSLIIWDEAPMANKASVHSLDLLLRDINDCDLPFGGKVVVLGGDFRQVLPVVPRKSQYEAVEASLVSSFLWPCFRRFYLVENMRARTDAEFANFLLLLGDGKLQHEEVSNVELPANMVISFDVDSDPVDMLITHIFPEFAQPSFDSSIFIDRAVLTPRNDEVDMINSSLIDRFPGELFTYNSIDRLIGDGCNIYPVEFLNTLAPGGMTPHELKLKKNCPVMLLRNVDPSGGLCNGTRLVCKQFFPNVILCEIATGFSRGEYTLIHRVNLRPPSGSHFPFEFERIQFPIKLSFAMTINKAQGQTLDSVGIFLRQHCFSHGQLYVALSRARCSSSVKVMVQGSDSSTLNNLVRNIVSFEILRRAGIIPRGSS